MEYPTKEELIVVLTEEAKRYTKDKLNEDFIKDGQLNTHFLDIYNQKLIELVALKCSDISVDDYVRQACYGAGWRISKEIQVFFELDKNEKPKDGLIKNMLEKVKKHFGDKND